MSTHLLRPDHADCDCCAGPAITTPQSLFNRPGLPAINYRIGTHAQLRDSLLARLAVSELPALQRFTSRDDADLSIALLDASAAVADILTFYQERIANESYLRSAIERESVQALARLIGYELAPGVAAETHLAFTVEEAAGSPHEVTVPAGTRVQSIPGPGEKPQTFETSAPLDAHAGWNALRPRTTRRWSPSQSPATLYVAGLASGLKAGDALLFVVQGAVTKPANNADWHLASVSKVDVQSAAARTKVTLAANLPATLPESLDVYVMRQRAAMYGYNAPDPRTLSSDILEQYAADFPTSGSGNFFMLEDSMVHGNVMLRALGPGGGGSGPSNQVYMINLLDLQSKRVDWDFTRVSGGPLLLDTTYSAVLPQSWAVVENGGLTPTRSLHRITATAEQSPQHFTLTTKVTGLTLNPGAPAGLYNGSQLRSTTVYVQSEPLVLAEEPDDMPFAAGTTQIEVVGAVEPMPAARAVMLVGQDHATGARITELAEVAGTAPVAGINATRLTLAKGLTHGFARAGLTIHANVVHATAGETVTEALGSGDAARPFQRFKLRQGPLTYVHGKTTSGSVSTLELRVNDLRWDEVPTLFESGPSDRVYTVRLDDQGIATLQFGDGVNGARPPTGQENVKATYRKGTGLAGQVAAGQLSLILTPVLGIRSVTNPEPAAGAEDAEQADQARRNAPLKVLTLDRVVSLRDYEDHARGFASVARALATWFWAGNRRIVLLTLAGPGGAIISPTSTTATDLLGVLRDIGDARVPVTIVSHRPITFHLAGSIKADPAADPAIVKAQVEARLRARFGFDARAFAQPATLLEVLATIHEVPEVVSADIDRFAVGSATGRTATLTASGPELIAGVPAGAQLLTLDPEPLALEVVA